MYVFKNISCFLVFAILISCIQTKSSAYQLVPELGDDIPDSIIQKSTTFIKSKVGEKYFKSFIKFDAVKSNFRKSYRITHPPSCAEKLKNPHYFLVYNIQIPDMGEDLVPIEFITDTLGNIISECFIDKIPTCPDTNCWSYFPVVKKADAIRIAKNEDLEEGIKDWIISFHFDYEDFEDYVWDIKTTLSRGGTYYGRGASGKGILISAIDGSVIRIYGWGAIH